MFRPRWLTAFVAITAAFVLVTADVQARPLGGFSAGSRGMRTYSAPPSTATAPSAAPIQRSMTQPSNAAPIGRTTPSSGLFTGRGLFGGLAAGFLGAGLLGLLFGYGFFWWDGWLCFDPRPVIASRVDRDRGAADLRLVAPAQNIGGAFVCSGVSHDRPQLCRSSGDVEQCKRNCRRTTYHRKIGL